MSSARRHNANLRNARKSTGPRTPAGKSIARLNALTHGAFAADLLLPGEDPVSFRHHEAGFWKHYNPATPAEYFLVNRMILASWRLLRLAGMETRVLRSQAGSVASNAKFGSALTNYIDACIDKNDPPTPREPSMPADPIARAWILDASEGNTLLKLSRYQTWLERSFYRAHRLLQSLRNPG